MSTIESQGMPPEPARTCTRCGAELVPGAEECARCLLRLALAAGPEAGPSPSEAAESSVSGTRSRPGGPPPTLEEVRAAFPALAIESLLGQGGMGAVFRARQPQLERTVALKVLPRSLGEDPSFAERFGREARALARLAHPGIVSVHDFGCADGLHYLLMEFVDGVNLRVLLQGGALEPRQALAIARELCDALQYAHDEGVVHRDIKPENVLVDTRGRVKVADFGLAKLIDTTAEAALTRGDQVMGTPHYMAPEQLERPLEVDHRADLFALGVVLYEMLTGSLPRGNFEPPSRRVQVDVRLDEIVLKALEHEPTRRYQQALEIKTDVEHVSEGGTARAKPAPHAPRSHARSSQRVVRDAPLGAARGWRAGLLFGLTWVLFGLSWNLGPFACGLGAVLLISAHAHVLRERVRAVPGWSQALARAGQRFSRRFTISVGGLLCVFAIAFGHLLHWERGVHTWQPIPAGGADALFALWGRDPWALLRFAAPGGDVSGFVPLESQPRVVMVQNTSSLPFEPVAAPWLLILGGFLGLGLVLASSVWVRESSELRRRAWSLGAELSSIGLCALVVLWVAAPLAALRSPQVLQELASNFQTSTSAEETLARLRAAFQEHALEVEVEQSIRVVEHREAHELASAVLLCASTPDPFERWSTSFSGAVRETPRLWVTLCPKLDGSGTVLQIRAGLLDPRTPQFARTQTTLNAIEDVVQDR